MYSVNGNRLLAGDRLVLSDLGQTLERLAEHGADDLYRGELARALSSHLREHGGEITLRDLSDYRVDPQAAGARLLPRPRVPLQPTAVDRRRPDRARAAPLSNASAPPARPAAPRRWPSWSRSCASRKLARGRPVHPRALPRRLARRLPTKRS